MLLSNVSQDNYCHVIFFFCVLSLSHLTNAGTITQRVPRRYLPRYFSSLSYHFTWRHSITWAPDVAKTLLNLRLDEFLTSQKPVKCSACTFSARYATETPWQNKWNAPLKWITVRNSQYGKNCNRENPVNQDYYQLKSIRINQCQLLFFIFDSNRPYLW